MHQTIDIETTDGVCPAHIFAPEDDRPHPGVVLFMDAGGVRPALVEMAERLASGGYVVLLPDLYYRSGYSVANAATLFSDPVVRADWFARIRPTLAPAHVMRDMPAFLAVLDAHPRVRRGAIGTTGYCLGGGLSLSAAGTFPDRVAAAASYHGGGLATDAPDSPHLLAPRMKARVYVGGATGDSGFDDAQKERLHQALATAGVEHTIETYNAKHGWVPSDTAVHDAEEAERHWDTLFALLRGALRD